MIMIDIELAIIGNPNSGKTTLFNALTGEKQEVGNWPGVTVEKKVGYFRHHHHSIKLVDLPGTYSLLLASEELSLDEKIAYDYLLSHQAKLIINVVDASNLERHLYLTLQLLEMGLPVIVALNMMDIVKKRGLKIDLQELEKYLGCPVVAISATKNKSLASLKECILKQAQSPQIPMIPFAYPKTIEKAVNHLISILEKDDAAFSASKISLLAKEKNRLEYRRLALSLLEGDCLARSQVSLKVLEEVKKGQIFLTENLKFEPDILMAEARYSFISDLILKVVKRTAKNSRFISDKLDKVLLNRFLGLPIFLLIMYGMFMFAINIGGAFQDFFDMGSEAIFVKTPAYFLKQAHAPSWFIALITEGVGKAINTVLTFIPVIGSMFFALSFLEQSGYMSRAAFVVDRLMRFIGLPGKSFVPMIVGFGCNVPAVLATRTLESKRDRILTVMMSPFMSCGARLAIFAAFTAVFFPHGGAGIVFALYIIGILIAIMTGFVLRKTLLKGQSSPFVLELPTYHWPSFRSLRLHTWHRLKAFVFKAGLFIIPMCTGIGFLNHITYDSISLLAYLGRIITPLFSPMGIISENWPASVGLLTGFLAKEVVVGTLNTLYMSSSSFVDALDGFDLGSQLWSALLSIPYNLREIGQAIWNPFLAAAPSDVLEEGVMGNMYALFSGKIPAFAYLLFVLLYFPCVSTTVAIAREIGQAWAWFSVFWTTFIAYGVAVCFYQIATWSQHKISSTIWILSLMALYFLIFYFFKRYSPKDRFFSKKNTKAPRCGGCIS